jgi:uncharacterized cupredoxin-like copper-binding protein
MQYRLLALLCAMLLLVVAACAGQPRPVEEERPGAIPAEQAAPEAAAGAAVSLSVEMGDMYFEEGPNNLDNPPVWQVSRGAEVTLELINVGNLDHNWAIVALGQEVPEPYVGGEDQPGLFYWSADVVPPAETEVYTFTAPAEPGSYQVICTVPGHYPAMQGILEVQ